MLAEYNGEPVMVEEENLLITTFHPELTDDMRIHKYFLELTKNMQDKAQNNPALEEAVKIN